MSNSVAGLSGGVSCPSEVRVVAVSESEGKKCCCLWLVGSAGGCLLLRPLVRLNLVSLSFPTSDPPLFVGRILSSYFLSAPVSRSTVVSFVLVWIQFELCWLGIFVNFFVDSLGWLLQGEFVVFPLEFLLNSHELFPLEFSNELGWFHDLSH